MTEREKEIARLCVENPELSGLLVYAEKTYFKKGILAASGCVLLGTAATVAMAKVIKMIRKD